MTATRAGNRAASPASRDGRGVATAVRAGWARTYAATPYRELPWFRAGPKPFVRAAVEEGRVRPPGSWLEIGCGAGSDALWLARRGFRVTGIDIAPGAVAAGRERARARGVAVRFVEADVLRPPFPPGAFRYASDNGCFHTLPFRDRPAYAAGVARLLRPGGRFLLSWAAREETARIGPPHRLSVEEVARPMEPHFLLRRVEFVRRAGRRLHYEALLERRREPQPPRR